MSEAVIERVVVEYRYDVTMPDGLTYIVRRKESAGKIEWSVRGGSWLRGRNCDPDGRTHKRVVAAVQAALTPWGTVAA